MKKIIFYSITLIFVFSFCKKKQELPQPEITDPHFYVNCDMDGQPFKISAGDDNYYMSSSWYHQDSNNIYVYKGNLAKQTGSGYQVTFLINDISPATANESMKVDSTLSLGEHLYNDQNSLGLTQSFSFIPLKGPDANSFYGWSITDGINTPTNIAASSANYSISTVFNVGTSYSVTQNYSDVSGTCGGISLTNVFKAGSKLNTSIIAVRNTNANPEFKYSLSYRPIPSNIKCFWEFYDNNSSSTNFTITDRVFIPGTTTKVKLTLTEKTTNEIFVANYEVNATNGSACEANYMVDFLPVKNIRLYSSVTVLLTDPSGTVYSSQGLIQPSSSSFEILSVSNYNANENGQPTKRLNVKFNCVVKNGSKEINLKNGEAMIAVAYK